MESPDAITYGMGPTIHSRACKHCGKSQVGKQQPRMLWVDREEAGSDFIYHHLS